MTTTVAILTPSQIETLLRDAAKTHNISLMNQALGYITAANAAQLSPATISSALQQFNAYQYSDQTAYVTCLRSYMSKLGSFVDSATLGNILVPLSATSTPNFQAIDALTDYLTAQQKSTFSSLSFDTLATNIARYTMSPNNGDAMSANAIRDIVSKLGSVMSGQTLGLCLRIFSNDTSGVNFQGIDAVTDYLTVQQKATVPPIALTETLMAISRATAGLSSGNDHITANAARDIMIKFGGYVPGDAIGVALVNFANDTSGPNLNGIDAVTDYLDAKQISNIPPQALVDTLSSIAWLTNHPNNGDTISANAARDLMVKIGHMMPAQAISAALMAFTMDTSGPNLQGIDAVTDNLSAQQKAQIGSWTIDNTLNAIIASSYPGNATQVLSAVRDFMSKLGGYVSVGGIEDALSNYGRLHNLQGIDAITDYLTASQKAAINPQVLGNVLQGIASPFYFNEDLKTIAVAVKDFMSKLGATVPIDAINSTFSIMIFSKNTEGILNLTDTLSQTQAKQLPATTLSQVLGYLIEPTFSPDVQGNKVAAENVDHFMSKMATVIDSNGIVHAARDFLYDHNSDGLDAIFSHLSDAQIQSVLTSVQNYGDLRLDLLASGYKVGTANTDIMNYMSSTSAVEAFGLNGNDMMYGSNSTSGHDKLYGGQGNDLIIAWAGNDLLDGGKGNDTLYGLDGNDMLRGDQGADLLLGGLGADTFIFNSLDAKDQVADFSAIQGDKLDLSSIIDLPDNIGAAINDYIKATTTTTTNTTGSVSYSTTISVDMDGKGAGASVAVVTLDKVQSFNVQDMYIKGSLIV